MFSLQGELPAVIEALKAKGWRAEYTTTNQEQQRKVFIQRAKAEFETEQRRLYPNSLNKRAKFVESQIAIPKELTDEEWASCRFFYSWIVIPPWAREMHEQGLLRSFSQTDGAHANSDHVMIDEITLDANSCIVLMGESRFNDTERATTVAKLDRAVTSQIPQTDTEGFVNIRDAQKGSMKSIQKVRSLPCQAR